MLKTKNLYNLLAEQVTNNKEKSAIIFDGKELCYGYFLELVDKIVTLLRNMGLEKKGIAIALPRSPLMLATLFATVKTGNYYIPLDLSYPDERIRYILNHSEAPIVISDQANMGRFHDSNVICVESELNEMGDCFKGSADYLNEVAYCLYTSGSTGDPKGVLVSESSLINFINGMLQVVDFKGLKVIVCTTTQCFDIFFLESIMALCIGLTVVLCDDKAGKNPKQIISLIKENNVDVIQMTPSRIRMLAEYDQELEAFENVRTILVGGEDLPISLLNLLKSKTKARIYNMYGPTETTIWSMVGELTDKDYITIGNPILNTEIYIIDQDMNILGSGEAGEICISGDGLAKGYLHAPELTKDRFVSLDNGIRIYKTGDYGKKSTTEEEYFYLGRTDNQIKLNGFRIELEEIEKISAKMPGMIQNIVGLSTNDSGNQQLVQYFIGNDRVDSSQIVDFLKTQLPQYMIPNQFIRVEEFNYTLNGKIDRKKLPDVPNITLDNLPFEEPDNMKKVVYETIYQVTGQVVNINNKKTVLSMINSFDYITIFVALENYFDVEFEEDYLTREEATSIDNLCDNIQRLIDNKEELKIGFTSI